MPEDNEMQLQEIQTKCLDSEGYMLFAAYLTPQKDKEERSVIEFQYRRYHFNLEDAKNSLLQLKKFIDNELQKLIAAGEEEPA